MAAGVAACKGEELAGTAPGTTFPVDLMNFTVSSAQMGQATAGATLLTVDGNPTNGNPTRINPLNPGIGNSVAFTAIQGSVTFNATCTVTDITNVSAVPSVVLQPGGLGFDCVDWNDEG